MRNITLILISMLGMACLAVASDNLIENGDFRSGMKGWSLGGPKVNGKYVVGRKVVDGALEVQIPADGSGGMVLLLRRVKLKDGERYLLSYDIELEEPGTMRHLYQASRPPHGVGGCVKDTPLPAGKHHIRDQFETYIDEKELYHFTFNLTKLRGKVRLSNIKVHTYGTVEAEQLSGKWKVFLDAAAPSDWGVVPEQLKGADGTGAVSGVDCTLAMGETLWLQRMCKGPMREKRSAVLYTEFDSDRDGVMSLGMSADWWLNVYLNGEAAYSNHPHGNGSHRYDPNDNEIELHVRKGRNVLAVNVESGSRGWRFLYGKQKPRLMFKPDEDWLPIDMSKTHIVSGSALDMSGLVDAPAGKHGRLDINEKGELVFEHRPNEPVRLQGFNGLTQMSIADEDKFRAAIRSFAETARRQGYSIFRVNGVLDRSLMKGSTADMSINPKMLDRWDYVISEFKKQGIYIHLVVLSYGLYDAPSENTRNFDIRNGHRLLLHFGGEWERAHFKYGAETLLNHVNPYTKLAWKDDPAIAFVEFYNEQCSGFGALVQHAKMIPGGYELVMKRWRDWLVAKYPNGAPAELLPELGGKPLSEAPLPKPLMRGGSPLSNEFGLFRVYIIKDGAEWCEKIVRGTGYKGLTTNYNALKRMADVCARWQCIQVNDMHSYYQHPRGGWGAPGCTVEQESSLVDAVSWWRGVNSQRFAGRPMIVSEFNHSFWNPYQHEAGLVFPAYSAFQNYASLQIHADVSDSGIKRIQPVHSFGVGNSPIVRANEFLSNCLYLRGDVTPAKRLVEYAVSEKTLGSNGLTHGSMANEQSRIGLLTGLAIAFPWAPLAPRTVRGPKADIQILPEGIAEVEDADWFFNVLENKDGTFSLSDFVSRMKNMGILSKENKTDVSAGVFENETGEITLRTKEKLIKVVTARTEGVSLEGGASERLGRLTVDSSSVHGTVALCSVDGKPLSVSDRMVLIYSTTTANSYSTFSHDGRKKVTHGRLPILLRRGVLKARFRPDGDAGRFVLYTLEFNGERKEKVPVSVVDGQLVVNVDTGTLKQGPAVFFELVRE